MQLKFILFWNDFVGEISKKNLKNVCHDKWSIAQIVHDKLSYQNVINTLVEICLCNAENVAVEILLFRKKCVYQQLCLSKPSTHWKKKIWCEQWRATLSIHSHMTIIWNSWCWTEVQLHAGLCTFDIWHGLVVVYYRWSHIVFSLTCSMLQWTSPKEF